MQSTEQQTDELDALVSNFGARCFISTPPNNRSPDGMNVRNKSRPSSGNEAIGIMRQRSVFTAGKVIFDILMSKTDFFRAAL